MVLIVFDNELKVEFEINEETRDFLKKLNAPIGVISVAGMYRTGKSYLLNRMLQNQTRGFDVGPTINACTKVSLSDRNLNFVLRIFSLISQLAEFFAIIFKMEI